MAVFWKTLGLQWAVFAVSFAVTFLFVYGTFLILKRTEFTADPHGRTIIIGRRVVKLPVESMMRLVALGGSLFVAASTGAVMMADWQTFALYWYAPHSVGFLDPIFGRPLNFYLFTLPAWQAVSGWLLGMAILSCLIAGFFLLVNSGSWALEGRHTRFDMVPRRGISITFAFVLLAIAWRVYLGRFDLLTVDHTVFSGVTYTDAHIFLPGLLVVAVALIFGAGSLSQMRFWFNRGRWLIAAVIPAIVCYVAPQIAGWYVGHLIVKPNELVREQPYITNNIEMTRQAYGLDDFRSSTFPRRRPSRPPTPHIISHARRIFACGTGTRCRTRCARFRRSAPTTTFPTSTSTATRSTARCAR